MTYPLNNGIVNPDFICNTNAGRYVFSELATASSAIVNPH